MMGVLASVLGAWKPASQMPRWASRIAVELTDVRVEQVQDIRGDDALSEGVDPGCGNCGEWSLPDGCGCDNPLPMPVDSFIHGWNSLNAKCGHGWDTNPWVWVLSFRGIDERRHQDRVPGVR